MLMCYLGSAILGEMCRAKGYESLFDGPARTVSRDVFDLTISQNFWQRRPTIETEQLRLAVQLFEVVSQHEEQLLQSSQQRTGDIGQEIVGDGANDVWNWMNFNPQ